MAVTTYLIRMIPFVLFKKEIKNKFIKSLLYYIPYSVLAAMTIPSIFYSTDNILSASVGFLLALIASIKTKSLLIVSLIAVMGVFITNLIISFI